MTDTVRTTADLINLLQPIPIAAPRSTNRQLIRDIVKSFDVMRSTLVNVKDAPYNADPTGAADAATAINNAIQATVGGGIVYLPAGTYKILSPILGKSGVSIVGAGVNSTTIKNYANTDAIKFSVATGGVRRVRVADLFVDDALVGAARTAGHGINCDGTGDQSEIVIERVTVNQHMDGVRIHVPVTSSLRNVRCNIQRQDGFAFYGLGTSTTVESCYADAPIRHGFYTEGGLGYSDFISCAVDLCGGNAYHWGAVNPAGGFESSHICLSGCGAESPVGNALYMRDGDGHTVISCRFGPTTGVTKDVILIEGTKDVTIIGGIAFGGTGWSLRAIDSATDTVDNIEVRQTNLHASSALGKLSDVNGKVTWYQGKTFTFGKNAVGSATRMGLLSAQAGLQGNVGAAETDLFSYTLDADTLLTDGKSAIIVTVWGYTAANATGKRFKLKFGADTVLDSGSLALNNRWWGFRIYIRRNDATNQYIHGTYGSSDPALLPELRHYGFATRTLSVANIVKVTGQGGADGDITCRGMEILVIP